MDYWLRSTFPQNCWYLESTLVAVVNEEPFPGMDIVASMCLLYVGTGTLILHTFCLPLPNQVTVLKKQILSALYLAIATRTEYLKLIIPCFILWRKAKCTLSVKYLPFPIWCIIPNRLQTADASIQNWPQKGRKVRWLLLSRDDQKVAYYPNFYLSIENYGFLIKVKISTKLEVLWQYGGSKNPCQGWGWWPRCVFFTL